MVFFLLSVVREMILRDGMKNFINDINIYLLCDPY